jgi:hypothetical protein
VTLFNGTIGPASKRLLAGLDYPQQIIAGSLAGSATEPRLLEEIDADTYAAESTELRDQVGLLSIERDATDRDRAEMGEIAIKAFELSQVLRKKKWLAADYRAKRRLLEIVGLRPC